VAHVRDILKETGLEPQYLEFELTETAFMQGPEPTVAAKWPFDRAAVPRANRRALICGYAHTLGTRCRMTSQHKMCNISRSVDSLRTGADA
jgi:hypothetical protein